MHRWASPRCAPGGRSCRGDRRGPCDDRSGANRLSRGTRTPPLNRAAVSVRDPRYIVVMLILHTSDWHLGRTFHGVDILDVQARAMAEIVDWVRERGVALVLVAGDVYDRAQQISPRNPAPGARITNYDIYR